MVLVFVVLPIAEIYVLIQVGQVIGAWPTVLLLVADAIFGSWLVRREAYAAFRGINTMLNQGRMPVRELTDGALVVIGGALMLSPGFITDILGIFLIAPPTRPLARKALASLVGRRLTVMTTATGAGAVWSDPATDTVVVGEVVQED